MSKRQNFQTETGSAMESAVGRHLLFSNTTAVRGAHRFQSTLSCNVAAVRGVCRLQSILSSNVAALGGHFRRLQSTL